jgi:hypothetical protein
LIVLFRPVCRPASSHGGFPSSKRVAVGAVRCSLIFCSSLSIYLAHLGPIFLSLVVPSNS